MRSNSNAWHSSWVSRMGDHPAYSYRDRPDAVEAALPARYRSPGRSDLPTLQLELMRRNSRESTPGAKPGEEENNEVRRRELLSFFTRALRSPEREARRAFGQLLAQGRRLAIADEAALTPYRADSPPAALLRSLYATGETSQGPDRCAVVPLIGSRMVGSTVRL